MKKDVVGNSKNARDEKGQSSKARVPDLLVTFSNFFEEFSYGEMRVETAGNDSDAFDLSDNAAAHSSDEDQQVVDEDSLAEMNIAALKELAMSCDISLRGSRLKADDIIQAIVDATVFEEDKVHSDQSSDNTEDAEVGSTSQEDDEQQDEHEDEDEGKDELF